MVFARPSTALSSQFGSQLWLIMLVIGSMPRVLWSLLSTCALQK
jgi:hypothetical protein